MINPRTLVAAAAVAVMSLAVAPLAVAPLGGGVAQAADVANGEKVFAKRQCKICHALEAGKKKPPAGPNLNGVFGRTSGTLEGFKFSKAMKEAAIVWDEETIDAYLKAPKKYIPKNRMASAGVKDDTERADLIAFLKEATQPPQ